MKVNLIKEEIIKKREVVKNMKKTLKMKISMEKLEKI